MQKGMDKTWVQIQTNIATLDDLPNKWYKMEESQGETFIWLELKEKFIKEFRCKPKDDKLVRETTQIRTFIQLIFHHASTQNHNRLKASCNNIRLNKIP